MPNPSLPEISLNIKPEHLQRVLTAEILMANVQMQSLVPFILGMYSDAHNQEMSEVLAEYLKALNSNVASLNARIAPFGEISIQW